MTVDSFKTFYFLEVFKDHERKRFYDTMTQVKPTARYVKMSKTDIYSKFSCVHKHKQGNSETVLSGQYQPEIMNKL